MLPSVARLFATLTLVSNLVSVFSSQLHDVPLSRKTFDEAQLVTSPDQRVLSATDPSSPAAPHFIVYSDKWVSGETGPPAPSVIEVRVYIHVFATSSHNSYAVRRVLTSCE